MANIKFGTYLWPTPITSTKFFANMSGWNIRETKNGKNYGYSTDSRKSPFSSAVQLERCIMC